MSHPALYRLRWLRTSGLFVLDPANTSALAGALAGPLAGPGVSLASDEFKISFLHLPKLSSPIINNHINPNLSYSTSNIIKFTFFSGNDQMSLSTFQTVKTPKASILAYGSWIKMKSLELEIILSKPKNPIKVNPMLKRDPKPQKK